MKRLLHYGICLVFSGGLGLFPNRGIAQEPEILSLVVQDSFLPNLPVLVRVEVLTPDGRPDWWVWDDQVVLSSTNQSIVPSVIPLHNGRGSAMVTFAEDADFELIASWNGLETRGNLQGLTIESASRISGTLAGDQTTWQGLIHITNDLTVPDGHLLILEAGTLVLVDGVDSGSSAPDILINGSIDARGTESKPIAITCSQPGLNWGQIRHADAQPSLYRYTSITRGGRANGEGHTGTGPVIRVGGSDLIFEQCTISDLTDDTGATIGKIMNSVGGSTVTFDGCILARARMGPELDGTALLCTNTHVINMYGPDDDDAIYIHSQNAGQRAVVTDSVVAFMDDDGVDTLGATVDVENCLIRDVFDKGTSVLGAETRIRGCLYVNCGIGISSKASNGDTVTTRISQSTIFVRNRGIAAENKGGGSPDAIVNYWVTNTIIRAFDQPQNTIYTDYDPVNIRIVYSNLGEPWPGQGNQTEDPNFVDPVNHDFHLGLFSPCIDQGDPLFPEDGDGSRSDMGYFPFEAPAPVLSDMERLSDGRVRFLMHGYTNRLYRIETAERLGDVWEMWGTNFLEISPWTVEDNSATGSPTRYYRAKLGR